MQKITAESPESKSPDLAADNLEKLKALFPELVTESKEGVVVNVDVLKQLVGDKIVADSEEKYGMNWHGKRRARQIALTPSTGTLRPYPAESVDWDTTKNLMIEGDNLEVLKLLQKSYAGKVKLIYIDPPYNTGKDFVYPDNFQDNIKNYLELTGQTGEGGRKLSSNTEASGRFHTDWLNMMYPRLKLARNLLHEDGVIFISIDEAEHSNLRKLCDEIFGEENFVESIAWNKRIPKNDKGIGNIHEYILIYLKSAAWDFKFTMPKEGLEDISELVTRLKRQAVSIPEAEAELRKFYEKKGYDRGVTLYNNLDQNYRIWGKINVSWPNATTVGPRYDVPHPISGKPVAVPDRGWRWKKETFDSLVDYEKVIKRHDGTYMCGQIWFDSKETTQPSLIKYLDDVDTLLLRSVLSLKSDGGMEVEEILGAKNVSSYPKPTALLRMLIQSFDLKDGDVVLDFFAGSGTTAHATLQQNSEDKKQRRYILVQMPEPLDPEVKEQKDAANYCEELGKPKNIAELTKERLRRAAKMVRDENSLFAGDLGFRVFKLDSTNIREWDPKRDNLAASLEESVEHLKKDRSSDDILYELLLKLGLDLCVPIETRILVPERHEPRKKGKPASEAFRGFRVFRGSPAEAPPGSHTVHSIGAGTLLVCLSPAIPQADVEPLAHGIIAWHQELKPAGETTVVFRDSAFADDVAKTNLAAILQQHGLENVRSL
jgi:adenine-specific DNA-methyltransferase